MACGKPPEPGRATAPSERCDFALSQTHDLIEDLERMVALGDLGDKFDKRIASVERAMERLRSTGIPESQIDKIEGKIGQIRGNARGADRREAIGLDHKKPTDSKAPTNEDVLKSFSKGIPESTVRTCVDGLTKSDHHAHDDFKKAAFKAIEANSVIPETYKDQLVKDVAKILRNCPDAGGLVSAMITRGQPKGAFVSDWKNRSNKAVGATYEIMGTSALYEKESKPANAKHNPPSLRIDQKRDKIDFGPRSFLNSHASYQSTKRGSAQKYSESDLQIYNKELQKEIGVDFKHVKDAGTSPKDKRIERQLEKASEAIRQGHVEEFHFVSNGEFSGKFKELVDKTNDELVASGNSPIACHEYVNSLGFDPLTDGKA